VRAKQGPGIRPYHPARDRSIPTEEIFITCRGVTLWGVPIATGLWYDEPRALARRFRQQGVLGLLPTHVEGRCQLIEQLV
jgi:hypothetical protein